MLLQQDDILADINTRLSVLNNQFAIKDLVFFEEKINQQFVIKINNEHAQAEIMLQGAQLIHWQPLGQEPVIWLSDEAVFNQQKSIRGGVPVCWPWFGAHESEQALPAHGYARTTMWQPIDVGQLSDGRTRLVFRLVENSETAKLWPHNCQLDIVYIIGLTLEIELITTNQGKQTAVISEALHTYFYVGDVNQVSITGLHKCHYLDKPDDFKQKKQNGTIYIAEEVDRIYLNTTTDVTIVDPILNRQVIIKKNGSYSTIVWNPWKTVAEKMGDLGVNGYLRMLCIESANAASNAVSLKQGESHSLNVEYLTQSIINS